MPDTPSRHRRRLLALAPPASRLCAFPHGRTAGPGPAALRWLPLLRLSVAGAALLVGSVAVFIALDTAAAAAEWTHSKLHFKTEPPPTGQYILAVIWL
jgi:hypothetical protein